MKICTPSSAATAPERSGRRSTAARRGPTSPGTSPISPSNDLVLDADNHGTIVAATDLGMFRTDNDGASWYGWSRGFPTTAAIELTWDRAQDRLRVGTHGRSMWEWREAAGGPTSVPDGGAVPGTPLRADRVGTTQMRVRWDSLACTARDYNLFFCDLALISTGAYTGAVCGLGTSGTATMALPDTASGSAQELKRKGVTLSLLWVEYRQEHRDGYGYSQFCQHYREWKEQLNPTMRQKHKAGEKLFVDYAGQTVSVVDPETGEMQEAQVFVATLGASNYTYAEAHWSQSLPNWIAAQVRALEFLGGVPQMVVPDNLKAGVTSPNLYEPDLNPTYQDFAHYYGIAVVPARVRKPRDKAKVEVGVQVVERWILARLRDRTFFSLAELNQAITTLLGELNQREMKHLGQTRRQLFEAVDQPALSPLPETPYEFALWKKARVHIDYHVAFDKHFYSVPYTLTGKEVAIRATEKTVEIFYERKRVASHPRSSAKGRFSTQSVHTPPEHQFHFKDGSNQWWTAVQARNHRNPIVKLEYLDDGGQWVAVPRTPYNYFVQTNPGMGSGPYAFRVTDSYGNVLTDSGIPHIENGTIDGVAQFPPGP